MVPPTIIYLYRERGGKSFWAADITFAEVLLICSMSWWAPNALRRTPRGLRLVWWDSRDRIVWQRHLLTVLTNIDDGALWKAEVSTKVVDTLHPSFACVVIQGTFINV